MELSNWPLVHVRSRFLLSPGRILVSTLFRGISITMRGSDGCVTGRSYARINMRRYSGLITQRKLVVCRNGMVRTSLIDQPI